MRRLLTGCLVTLLLLVNTLILIGPLMVFALLKLVAPGRSRDYASWAVMWIAETWAEIDKLIADARTSFDGTARDAALAKLHARIVEEAPFIWIAHDVGPRAMSPKVKGVVQPRSWFIDIAPMSIE